MIVVGTIAKTGNKVVVHLQGNANDMETLSLYTGRSILDRDGMYPRITVTPREAIAICQQFPNHIQLEGDIYE
jgi:hypothetical protein